ncbi:protein of unknown function - conserved [Leishmania donovani]|uniref:Hypothetical_protein_conserved n=1 Tax=Leishmania donovani TaxID=5661 RepID=A0A3Q8IKU7_LEIDO|nr:hypothetical protein, conserved [Leishmania donovani]AYU78468.1 hypothetical protein LdCL_210005500 [Leishmania donovani]TPP49241.1 hypothetical protein CGC21_33745 [Leishmania donovani]TPP54775.1 hypothetical protein CGC20_22840 [Leishmania donovani]CAJ1988475.1 protein of unknown function - conserved [Leishmania donovani]CBZ33817.1 hypothetical protein, conserved [Leishmania donovani]
MRKFMLETKAALGVAPKTVDWDFEEKAGNLKTINHTLSDYKSAVEQTRSASQNLLTSMESMLKVLETMTRGNDIPDNVRGVVGDFAQMVQKAHCELLVDFKKTLDDDDSVAEIESLAGKCKSLEARRSKVMNEYDAYREAVTKKEAEYRKKGKDLCDSKLYEEEVSRRDSLKAGFQKIDKEFKETYAELEKKKLRSYMAALSTYLASTSQLMGSIHKEMESTKRKADMVKI